MDKNKCIICLEYCNIINNNCSNCNIYIHKKCLTKWYYKKKQIICPICKKVLNNNINIENIEYPIENLVSLELETNLDNNIINSYRFICMLECILYNIILGLIICFIILIIYCLYNYIIRY
jgi:hypothetical protein